MAAIVLRRKPLPKANPQADARFQRLKGAVNNNATRLKRHEPPRKKAADASAASKDPPGATLAQGKAKQVDKVQEAPAGKAQPSSFIAMLEAEIEKIMPKTLGETEQFMKGGSSGGMKSSLKGNAGQQKETVTKDVASANKQAPAPAGDAKTATPIPGEPAPTAAPVPAAQGMPAPKSDDDVSLQDSTKAADEATKEFSPQQMNDKIGKPVGGAKDAVVKNAAAGPAKYRGAEKAVAGPAAAQAVGLAARGAAVMVGVRGGKNTAVRTKQEAAKAKEDQERTQFKTDLETIYDATKAGVTAKLEALDGEVNTKFDQGVDGAITAMTTFVEDKIYKWKLKRYLLMPGGLLLWAKDALLGLPDDVKPFYDQGLGMFKSAMRVVFTDVNNLVERRLSEAKAIVARGQAQIKARVARLSPSLRAEGERTAAEFTSRFDELKGDIENKKSQLAAALAEKYKEALDKANAALKKIQDENKGLVDKLAEAVGELIKILTEFKAKLMGILRKGEETIKLILADPIGFLGNLIAAIKAGIAGFVANIWTHLKKGFFAWLFGALAEAGIAIPSGLPSLPAILQLVLAVLGITYERMRAKAVKLIGEKAVTVLETLGKYVKALIDGGPAKLWEQIKGDLGSLKAMVIDAIQDYIVTTVVQRATIKLISMFNPAGAIIQAVLAIYDTVTFLIEKASQIMALVEAVINSVHAIATGAIGGAAAWIEQALARAIPVVIGFLAQFAGLGKVSKKIKEFIQKVQGKVDAAIDKVIAKVVAVVKKLVGKGGKGKDAKSDERSDAQKQKDLDRAVADGDQLLKTPDTAPEDVKEKLPGIRTKYKLTTISLVSAGSKEGKERFYVEAIINPKKKSPDEWIATGMETVRVVFQRQRYHDILEYERQAKLQEGYINNLTVFEWVQNKTKLKEAKASTKVAGSKKKIPLNPKLRAKLEKSDRDAREALREEYIESETLARFMLIPEAQRQAMSPIQRADTMNKLRDAARIAARSKAALHTLDKIGGGDPTDVEFMGDTSINSSIGAQWGNNVPTIMKAVNHIPKKVRRKINMRVYFSVISR